MDEEPGLVQIAMMAARIYSGGEHSPKWSVRTALQIWDQAIDQLKDRRQRKEAKEHEVLRMRARD